MELKRKTAELKKAPSQARYALQGLITGRAVTFPGSEELHDAFEAAQADLEARIETLDRLSKTDTAGMTPSIVAAMKSQYVEAYFEILKLTEILLTDRQILCEQSIAAKYQYTADTTPDEMDKAKEHLAKIGFMPENLEGFHQNPRGVELRFNQILFGIPSVRSARAEHNLRRAQIDKLQNDMHKTKQFIGEVQAIASDLLQAG